MNRLKTLSSIQNGFSLIELLIYSAVFSLIVLGGLQLMSTFQVSSKRISDLADSAIDADSTILRLNTLLADSSEVDICNVYKTDPSLTDTQELSCGLEPGFLRDASCMIMRGNNIAERWGVEFDGDDHIAMDFRSTIPNGSDLSISMWFKDTGCNDPDGCTLIQLGAIDENEWWPSPNSDNDRIALVALNNSGQLQLRLGTQRIYSANESIVYPSITRSPRTLEEWNSGIWTHIVLTVEHDSSNDLDFGTTGSGADREDLSFDLYVNGSKLTPTNSISAQDLDILINQILLFGSYRPYAHFSGLIGPIQIFDEKISDARIRELAKRFYAPELGELNLSMRLDDYGTTNIFTRPASDLEFLNFTGYEAICDTGSAMPADKIRICRSFTDKDSFEEMFEASVQERSSGEAFMFARDPNSTLNWADRPFALFSNTQADNFCLSATDPGQTTNPKDSGWTRITEFKYFPGEDGAGNSRFFSQLEGSDLYQLLISSEFKSGGGQGLAATGSLSVTRVLADDALCQIAPDSVNFSIPSEAESSCGLRYATVVIQDGWQPSIDMLYITPTDGYLRNSFDLSDTSVTCVTDPPFDTGKNVHGCRKTSVAPDGNTYAQYTFKNIPLLESEARAVYDAQFGTLTIDAGDGNTPDPETWFQVLKQVRYATQDGISEETPYEPYRTILFSLGDRIPFYPDDDPDDRPHYYAFVDDPNIHWDSARFAASANSAKFCGLQGYLTSVSTEAENDFIYSRFANADGSIASGWIGGTDHHNWASQSASDPAVDDGDSTQEGNYRWVDGPEHGEVFWRYSASDTSDNIRRTGRYVVRDDNADVTQCYLSGETDSNMQTANFGRFTTGVLLPNPNADRCVARPGPACTASTYWFVNFPTFMEEDGTCRVSMSATDTNPILVEPNQSGNEHYIQITGQPTHSGTWNDLPHDDTTTDTNSAYYISGYYVEYGGCTSGTNCINDDDPANLAITARVEDLDLSALRQLCAKPN